MAEGGSVNAWLRVVRVVRLSASDCEVACARADTPEQCRICAKNNGEAYLLTCAPLPVLCPLIRYRCLLEDDDPAAPPDLAEYVQRTDNKPSRRRVTLTDGAPTAAEWVLPLVGVRAAGLSFAWKATRALCITRGLAKDTFVACSGAEGRLQFVASLRADAEDAALWLDGLHLSNTWWERAFWPSYLAWGRRVLETSARPSDLLSQLAALRAAPEDFVLRSDEWALRPTSDTSAAALGLLAARQQRVAWEAGAAMHAGVSEIWAAGHGAAQIPLAARQHPSAAAGLTWLLSRDIAAFDHHGVRLSAEEAKLAALGPVRGSGLFFLLSLART
jgi:hypothetical protein